MQHCVKKFQRQGVAIILQTIVINVSLSERDDKITRDSQTEPDTNHKAYVPFSWFLWDSFLTFENFKMRLIQLLLLRTYIYLSNSEWDEKTWVKIEPLNTDLRNYAIYSRVFIFNDLAATASLLKPSNSKKIPCHYVGIGCR